MTEIDFTKMNGAGNDFVVFNNYDGSLNVDLPPLAVAACAKGFGIGADGILVLKTSSTADFEMYYLNSDGSEGGMCGNGGRCIARFAVLNGISQPQTNFIAHGQKYSAEVFDADRVRLYFPVPEEVVPSKKVPVDGKFLDATYVHPNTDHTVLIDGFDNIETADLTKIARKIRYNFDIFPRGTNVDLIEKRSDNKIRMRTYERGVENETLACGTGAVASAIAAALRFDMSSPVQILTTSKETLTVSFDRKRLEFSNLVLEGSARVVFQGKILYDEKRHTILDLLNGKGRI